MSFLSQFHYQITGQIEDSDNSTRKLVFLHGLMGYGGNWRSIANAFKDEYQILYYDQRGHGQSFSPDEGYAPENFAEDLKKIIDELGWDKICLVGHSMGGRAAAMFAYLYPESVEKLIIEDIGPEASQVAIDKIIELIDGVPTPFSSKALAKAFFMNEFVEKFSDRPQVKLLGQFLYSNLTNKSISEKENSEGRSVFTWKFNPEAMKKCVLEGRSEDRFEVFAGLKMPTLLIRGENTNELPIEVYKRVLVENSNIIGVEIVGAGHWVHYDQPKEFSLVIKDFLSK